MAFQEGYARQWQQLAREAPEVLIGSSNRYQNWETVDPERWVPDGYVCVRVDSRGAGWSPGSLDVWSPREARDLYECIEWAARQPWSNGRVGLCGISYYAMNQWQVAALQPPHLAAMVPWEGAADWYREVYYHGGIRSQFIDGWYPRQVVSVQHGRGERAPKNPNSGESVAGPVTLPEEELARNRTDLVAEVKRHPLDDDWHRARSVDWSRVRTPFLSAANWGGQGLHPRGNFEAFTQAASEQKWLDVHGGTHFTCFYAGYGLRLQRRFFDHFLKGLDNGWDQEPRVRLQIRHVDGRFVERHEHEWPLARTRWTRLYLDPVTYRLESEPPAEGQVTYAALGEGVTFTSPPLSQEMEITGPVAAKLWVASSTRDADLFCVLRVFDPKGEEVVFQGSNDPNTPVAQGWLRASHRKLDPSRTLPYRPYHPHDEVQPLTPGEVYELDIEIWPTCIVVPPGYRVALSVRGRDYEYAGPIDEVTQGLGYRGCGPFVHQDPDDRPSEVFGGQVTLHGGGDRASYLLLPVIPAR
ncbi:MAG TPA: CocE/NonD family hydrolase [Candidatus Dormibacteraeota bacterium]|nr:CocE/NonD family hydrolase [Candidatus Dormibacteraeota bacterium]